VRDPPASKADIDEKIGFILVACPGILLFLAGILESASEVPQNILSDNQYVIIEGV
jgi:hypothetical protein